MSNHPAEPTKSNAPDVPQGYHVDRYDGVWWWSDGGDGGNEAGLETRAEAVAAAWEHAQG